MKLSSLITAVTMATVFASGAQAATAVYTDYASYSSATSVTGSYNFDGIAFMNISTSAPSFTVGPATFAPDIGAMPIGNAITLVVGTADSENFYGTPFLSLQVLYPPGSMKVSLSSPVNAISFDIGSYISPKDKITIAFDNSDSFVENLPGALGVTDFYGFASNTPFSSLTIQDYSTNVFGIDVTDFTLGSSVAAVPEPAAWALMLAGLGGVGAAMRHRRKRTVAA